MFFSSRTTYVNIRKYLQYKLVKASLDNRVVLNYWSPGYTQREVMVDFDTKEKLIKNFIPTTTFAAAGSYILKMHGEKSLELTHDVYPGYCSVQIRKGDHYLSIGIAGEWSDIGFNTTHKMTHSSSLEMDVLAMKRHPTKRIDLYTLNSEEICKLIEKLKKSKTLRYRLLGSRLKVGSSYCESECCATISYRCLAAGGFVQLLSPLYGAMSSQMVLTPNVLSEYAESGRTVETINNPEVKFFQNDFEETSREAYKVLEEIIKNSKHLESEDTLPVLNKFK